MASSSVNGVPATNFAFALALRLGILSNLVCSSVLAVSICSLVKSLGLVFHFHCHHKI